MFKRSVRPSGFVEPCIPSPAALPPPGPGWAHEIKHDGYRLIVRRDGDSIRLFTRRGYDWTSRYPVIAAAAGKLYARAFVIDGEAVVCGPDGVAVFDDLHGERRFKKESGPPGLIRSGFGKCRAETEQSACSPTLRAMSPGSNHEPCQTPAANAAEQFRPLRFESDQPWS
jgi:hypothetical protein